MYELRQVHNRRAYRERERVGHVGRLAWGLGVNADYLQQFEELALEFLDPRSRLDRHLDKFKRMIAQLFEHIERVRLSDIGFRADAKCLFAERVALAVKGGGFTVNKKAAGFEKIQANPELFLYVTGEVNDNRARARITAK